MRNDLLIIGRKTLFNKSFDFNGLIMLFSDKGYDIDNVVAVENPEDIKRFVESISQSNIIVVGDVDMLAVAFEDISLTDDLQYFKSGENTFILMPEFDAKYVKDIIIPILNRKSKTFYNTVMFKVFGKTEQEIRDIIKDCMRNRSKITFAFYEKVLECEVHIRYSSNAQSSLVNEVIASVGDLLKAYTYSVSDATLAEQVGKYLISKNVKLCVAETFCAGNFSAELLSNQQISSKFVQSIIMQSENAILTNAGISREIAVEHGIMSDEVAYSIAGNLLDRHIADVAIVVLGDSDFATNDNDRLYYIAVGDLNEIHVFTQHYYGNREDVIAAATKTAMYALYKFLSEKKNIL